jgi:glycosyltransferase involved in cell wall biosynthesis
MRVLFVHNYYQIPGGEDQVFEAESALVESRGHDVLHHTVHNDEVRRQGVWRTARATVWNPESYDQVAELARVFKPDVAHFHNTFPLVSPSAYYATRQAGAAVVQTLHNFRLSCVNGLFFRDCRPCEDCLGKAFAWPGVRRRCYRGSLLGSYVVARMTAYHTSRGTWASAVDRYIALTEFGKQKLAAAGLPAEKIAVKPNGLSEDPGPGSHDGGFALFVGRLSVEKGVDVMLRAWKIVGERLPLKIVGDGPLAREVHDAADSTPGVEWLGAQGKPDVYALMKAATVLVMPSTCYEGGPMALSEAKAAGLPALASGHGALAALVEHGSTGVLFGPGDAEDLAAKAIQVAEGAFDLASLGAACRSDYEDRFSSDASYARLMQIYEEAREARSAGSTEPPAAAAP